MTPPSPSAASTLRAIPAAPANAISLSRWPIVKSEAFRAISFVDPERSGSIALVVLALLVAHNLMGFSIPAIATHLALLALGYNGGVVVYNALNSASARISTLTIPVNHGHVSQFGVLFADRINAAIDWANAVLSFNDLASSARVVAYVWFAAFFAGLVTPGSALLGETRRTLCADRGALRRGGMRVCVFKLPAAQAQCVRA